MLVTKTALGYVFSSVQPNATIELKAPSRMLCYNKFNDLDRIGMAARRYLETLTTVQGTPYSMH